MQKALLNSLEPTRQLGYFCGLVLGDGTVFCKNSHHRISIKSTKTQILEQFEKYAKLFGLRPYWFTDVETRKFPNGTVRTDRMWMVSVSSKVLSEALKQCKKEDYFFHIPVFLNTKESLWGFIEGFFDAEGSVHYDVRLKNGICSLSVSSKHRQNLSPIQQLLFEFGIRSVIYAMKGAKCFTLQIHRRKDIERFLSSATLSFKCQNAIHYLELHKEEFLERRRQYLAQNQRGREYNRKYRMQHREKIADYNRQYRNAHREKWREYKRRYQIKHKCEVKP